MQKLSSYIGEDIQEKARTLYRLTSRIRTWLPPELASHCWIADTEDHILTIIMDSPDLASLIRFHQHEVLKQVNHELGLTTKQCLRRIKIKVSTVTKDIELSTKPMRRPSIEHAMDT